MKIDVGLIGKGKWGLKIKNNLIKITNLRFVIGKKHNLLHEIKKNNIRWIFIATPNSTHYAIVKNCLQKGINVFCEKPLCLSPSKAKYLIALAKKKKLKLYISDLYNFHSDKIKRLSSSNEVYRSKFVSGKDTEFFNRFMYHDISIFYKFLKNDCLKSSIFKLDKLNKNYKILIKLKKNKSIEFTYNLNSKKKIHIINNINIRSRKDFLKKMIYNVLYNNVDIEKNNIKALFIIKFLDTIKKKAKYVH